MRLIFQSYSPWQLSWLSSNSFNLQGWQGLQHAQAAQTCSWISSPWCWLWLQVELAPLQSGLRFHPLGESWPSPTCLGLQSSMAWKAGEKKLVRSYDVEVCRNQSSGSGCSSPQLLWPFGHLETLYWYRTLCGHCRRERLVLQPMCYRRTPDQGLAQSSFDQSNLWKLKMGDLALEVCCVCSCRSCESFPILWTSCLKTKSQPFWLACSWNHQWSVTC